MKLFEPITIRGMTLKNRIVMAPMHLRVGLRGKLARAYFAERAKGGVGAITFPGPLVDAFSSDEAWGKPGAVQSFIETLHALPDAVHQFGAKIGLQLTAHNRLPMGLSLNDTQGGLVAPSPDTEKLLIRDGFIIKQGEKARQLTITEIETIIERYATAAAGLKASGFDFAYVHGAHGFLACQFWAPGYNHRTDKYGGDLVGRMRFGIEVVTAMRAAVGDNFPIFYRLGVIGGLGVTIKDSITFARELAKAGTDVIDVSVVPHKSRVIQPNADKPMGTFAPQAGKIKQNVDVLVGAVGRINRPEVAEAILSEGKADLIYIGRQLLCDPYWPQKALEGRSDEIVECISCSKCSQTDVLRNVIKSASCPLNPRLTREYEQVS